MLLLMLERRMPIGMVLTADTGMEFPEMYEHLAKLDEHLYRERGSAGKRSVVRNDDKLSEAESKKMMNTAAGSNALPFNFPLATVRRGSGLNRSLNRVHISRALYCVTKLNSLGTESRRLQPPAEPVTMKSYSPFVWAA